MKDHFYPPFLFKPRKTPKLHMRTITTSHNFGSDYDKLEYLVKGFERKNEKKETSLCDSL